LVRRAILKAADLGVGDSFLGQLVPKIVEIYRESYPELASVSSKIAQILTSEETAFRKTLDRGVRQFDRLVGQKNYDQLDDPELVQNRHTMTGAELFKLQDTYGFPLELSIEEAERRGIKLSDNWQTEFDKSLSQQRQASQTASKGEFKGGLSGDSLIHTKYPTATHMLGAALRQVLGTEANQRGSNINTERLRLDFAHPEKLTPEQLQVVEDLVNQKIAEDLPVDFAEYDTDYAFDTLHAVGEFRDKYDAKVIVYTIGYPEAPFSVDICGGPHVKRTGQLGEDGKKFKITKQESSSAGVRRIKAILE
jgi:alanyl-tRNA synthetase